MAGMAATNAIASMTDHINVASPGRARKAMIATDTDAITETIPQVISASETRMIGVVMTNIARIWGAGNILEFLTTSGPSCEHARTVYFG